MNKWAMLAVALCMLVGIGLVVIVAMDEDDDYKLFTPLFNFCWDQLQSEVESCGDWAIAFEDIYGDEPAECLEVFDSDSELLLMCIGNIVEG